VIKADSNQVSPHRRLGELFTIGKNTIRPTSGFVEFLITIQEGVDNVTGGLRSRNIFVTDIYVIDVVMKRNKVILCCDLTVLPLVFTL